MLLTCLRNALIMAFGTAVAFVLIGLVFAALAGVLTGPSIGVVVAALIGPILLAAFIFAAAGFIQMAIICIVAANEAAAPAAGAPGGAEQGLDEDKDGKPWPTCKRCRWWQKFVASAASGAAVAIYLLVIHGK